MIYIYRIGRERRRAFSLGVGALIVVILSSCDAQLVTTSNFYDTEVTKANTDAGQEQGGPSGAKVPIRPVHGIPYYLPQTVIHLTIMGGYKKDDTKPAQPAPAAVPPTLAVPPPAAPRADDTPKPYQLMLKITGIEQVADPSRLYLLEYHTADSNDDDITIGVNAKGLLNSVDAISTDESGAILKKIAETFATVASNFSVDLVPTVQGCADPNVIKKGLKEFTLDWTQPISGTDGKDLALEKLQASIFKAITGEQEVGANAAPTITMNVSAQADVSQDGIHQPDNAAQFPDKKNPKNWAPGLRFRLPKVATLDLAFKPSTMTYKGCSLAGVPDQYTGGQPILYMDPNHDYVFDMSRTVLVKTEIKLSITDGVLLGAQIKRGSPALAAVTLPLDLINILISPITTLIHGPSASATGGTSAGSTTKPTK